MNRNIIKKVDQQNTTGENNKLTLEMQDSYNTDPNIYSPKLLSLFSQVELKMKSSKKVIM